MGRFAPNRSAARQLQDRAEARDMEQAAAERIRDEAERAMPRGTDPRRGHMADRMKVEQDPTGTRVRLDDPFGFLAEFGSAKNPPYAPLRRAVKAAGYRLEENPK